MSKNNGGPAFPQPSEHIYAEHESGGMTLLDYFAAQAMQGMIKNPQPATAIADLAYDQATAMLAERERRIEGALQTEPILDLDVISMAPAAHEQTLVVLQSRDALPWQGSIQLPKNLTRDIDRAVNIVIFGSRKERTSVYD